MLNQVPVSRKGNIMLGAGSLLQLFLGVIYVWSVFVVPVSEHFSWSVDSVKLTSSYMLCCFVLGILIGGKLQLKIGTSKTALAGGLCMAFGMLAASFAGALWVIYAAYGVIGGFGVGMAYNAIITCAQKWFPTKRGLATGITVCAFGFSTVIFAPLVEALVSTFDVLAAFRILSAAFALITLLLFGFITLPDPSGAATGAFADGKKQYTTSEALKTPEFYYIMFSMMLGTAAYFILNPSFKTLAAERGLDPAAGTALVMVTGIANALGRLGVPVISDKIGREKAAILILFITALCAAGLCFAGGYAFILMVALVAFCYGGYSGIYPLITGDYFGVGNVGSNYGAIMVGFAISALFFPMLVGGLADFSKFMSLAVMAACGGVLVILLGRSKKD